MYTIVVGLTRTRALDKSLQSYKTTARAKTRTAMVLRLALLLVELEIWRSVEFVFLVAGYTRNHCDRLFNVLKKSYRKVVNIYSMRSLVETLQSDVTSVRHVSTNDFKNLDKLEDLLYKPTLPIGSVKRSHIFRVDAVTDGNVKRLVADCIDEMNDQTKGVDMVDT